MKTFVIKPEDAEAFGIDQERGARVAATQLWESCAEQLQKADDVLVRLSSSLGQGGFDIECLDYDDMEERIRAGIDVLLTVEMQRREAVEQKYHELIYAVASKFPDETCHQTALRYIKNQENGSNCCGPQQA